MNGWWEKASTEQRLAQIDAGIELGLTAREVAICSGLSGDNYATSHHNHVYYFANLHGRHFPAANKARGSRTQRAKGNIRRAYWQGGRDLSDTGVAAFNAAEPEIAEVAFE